MPTETPEHAFSGLSHVAGSLTHTSRLRPCASVVGLGCRWAWCGPRRRDFRLVQFARLMSVTGRWAYTVTFAVFAYRSSGTAGVAVAAIVRLGPAAVAAPFAGSLIARFRIDTLLFRGGLARAAALAAPDA